MSDNSDQPRFEQHITPHLGSLLEFSLVLTKNGRDATQILRAALDQTAQAWDESVSSTSTVVHVQEVLLRQYHARGRIPELAVLWNRGQEYDRHKIENQLGGSQRNQRISRVERPWVTAIDRPYFLEVLADLPPLYRPAMFLSFLEGYSNSDIAELARTEVHEIESTLYRGCKLARSRLPEMLMGNPRGELPAGLEVKPHGITPWRGRWVR
jgi:hypothetical protein